MSEADEVSTERNRDFSTSLFNIFVITILSENSLEPFIAGSG